MSRRQRRSGLAMSLLLVLLAAPWSLAHEIRPAYLEIKETAPCQFSLLWRIPVMARWRLPVVLKLPDDARNLHPPVVQQLADSQVEHRWIEAGPSGLVGKRIEFPGLQLTTTDTLVNFELLDGRKGTAIVHPSKPWMEVTASQTSWGLVNTYTIQGIRHILFGADHLLFVLGLLFIVRGVKENGLAPGDGPMSPPLTTRHWPLFKTITAFTFAHSITLGVATLGYASLPLPPLNAAIALSILFLGPEIARCWKGEMSLTIRYPWVVAFLFGLLHGFGFASGLSTTGMPRTEIPLALLFFNVGVELGQLLFVFVALGLERSFKVLEVRWPRWATVLPGYTVGSFGAYWTIQRTLALLGGLK